VAVVSHGHIERGRDTARARGIDRARVTVIGDPAAVQFSHADSLLRERRLTTILREIWVLNCNKISAKSWRFARQK
jgi:hypothetical protein